VLAELGADVPTSGDPIEWEAARVRGAAPDEHPTHGPGSSP
jgi:hypothetical protein